MHGLAVTLVAGHLFKINQVDPEYLEMNMQETYHHITIQLAYLAQ